MTTESNQNNTVRTLNGLLPTLTSNTARLARLAASQHCAQQLAQQAQVHDLQILPSLNAYPASTSWASLSVQHPLGQAQVSFDLTPWPTLKMLATESESIQVSTDSALEASVLEILFSEAAQRLQNFGLEALSFRNLSLLAQDKKAASSPKESITLSFKLAAEKNERFALTVNQIDNSLLDTLEKLLTHQPVACQVKRSQPFPQLKIPGRALLGIQRLSIETIYSLREGDILLNGIAPHYRTLLNAHAALDAVELMWGTPHAKKLRCTGKLEGQMIVIKDTPVISEDIDNEETTAATGDEEELNDLAQLEVPVRLEVDTVMLPLAQLSALNTGYVIELPIPLSQASVRLTIHGQVIGFGELVAVGEHLAVRINKMAALDDSTD